MELFCGPAAKLIYEKAHVNKIEETFAGIKFSNETKEYWELNSLLLPEPLDIYLLSQLNLILRNKFPIIINKWLTILSSSIFIFPPHIAHAHKQ